MFDISKMKQARTEHALLCDALQQFDDYISRIEMHNNKPLSPKTIAIHRYSLNMFSGYMNNVGIVYLEDITQEHIEEFRAWMTHDKATRNGKGLATGSVQKVIKSLKKFFNWCVKRGLLNTSNPMDDIPNPQTELTPRRIITIDEFEKMLSFIDCKTFIGWRNQLMLKVMYSTGMRVSEVAHLKCGDYNQENGVAHVLGKMSQHRIVAFPWKLVKEMNKYINELGLEREHCLFPSSETGQPLTNSAIRKIVVNAALDAGIGHVYPHLLRYTFVTRTASVIDTNIVALKAVTGQRATSVVEHYTRLSEAHMRDLRDDLDRKLKKRGI